MNANNQQIGKIGEDIAASYLNTLEFTILERNWRHKHYEIDIIAYKHNLLHIIEVKTRNSLDYGYPEESIDKSKMQFLKNAASAYQFKHPQWKYLQFDIISITLDHDLIKEIFFIEDVYF
ncbi:MAG: YraN family protein [Sphingobacteriia bacterium]|nr:MAG: YraN family protein [Sphingobacteriia bacterium]